MSIVKFTASIKIRVVNPYILVSKTRAEKLKPGWRKPMPVLVQLNGSPNPPWKINMMPVGDGSFYLYLHNDIRKPSKTKVNDRVEVTLIFDETYHNGPIHAMPIYIKQALANNAIAEKNWDKLIPSRKKEVLRYFASLKADTVKQHNLKRLLFVLEGNIGRFLAREWKDGK
jgi:hypothetical protein